MFGRAGSDSDLWLGGRGSHSGATAAVVLEYFRATAGSDKILVDWKTQTEQDIVGFNLYRSEISGVQGQKIGDTFPAAGSGIEGATYSYADTGVVRGKRYYYSLEEIASSGGGRHDHRDI